jgi:hypothetical protein
LRRSGRYDDQNITLRQSQEMGRFLLGSTLVMRCRAGRGSADSPPPHDAHLVHADDTWQVLSGYEPHCLLLNSFEHLACQLHLSDEANIQYEKSWISDHLNSIRGVTHSPGRHTHASDTL